MVKCVEFSMRSDKGCTYRHAYSKPGVFYAGYASSAVVQASTDFWAYFEPIRQAMPQNCSADVQAVVSYIDATFTNGTQAEIQVILDNFGLGARRMYASHFYTIGKC